MKRLLLISTIFFGTCLYGQTGTIKVKKSKEKTDFEKLMRENPDTINRFRWRCFCGCRVTPGPRRHTYIMTGTGYENGWYGELGIERITLWHYAHVGVIGRIHESKGAQMRIYAQADVLSSHGYEVLSFGMSGEFAAKSEVKHTFQPYIGFQIPYGIVHDFQFNLGYSMPFGKKEELMATDNVFTIGLWYRL